MKEVDFGIAAMLAAVAYFMSSAGLNVPQGFEALHIVSAVASAAGFVSGRQVSRKVHFVVILTLAVLAAMSAVAYYWFLNWLNPGGLGVIVLTTLAFTTFYPFAFILSLARKG